MFTHDARLGIIKHNKLDGFVDPSISQAGGDGVGDAPMPKVAAVRDGIRRRLGIEADAEGG
jgi:hypothetical protein